MCCVSCVFVPKDKFYPRLNVRITHLIKQRENSFSHFPFCHFIFPKTWFYHSRLSFMCHAWPHSRHGRTLCVHTEGISCHWCRKWYDELRIFQLYDANKSDSGRVNSLHISHISLISLFGLAAWRMHERKIYILSEWIPNFRWCHVNRKVSIRTNHRHFRFIHRRRWNTILYIIYSNPLNGLGGMDTTSQYSH